MNIYIESENIWLHRGINIPNINLMYLTLISDIDIGYRYPISLSNPLPVVDIGIGYQYRNPIPTPQNRYPTHECRYRVL